LETTRPSIIARPEPRRPGRAVESAKDDPDQKVILLFDQDGHPVVPTCSPRADARKRRLASLTVASTTAAPPQKDDGP